MTAAELLSVAAFREGRHAQAFPSFGSERTGAPVVAFCRIDDKPIRLREPVMTPDALIIQDPTLLHQVDVFAGLADDGLVLINTRRSFEELGLGELAASRSSDRLRTVSATEIAQKHLGRPLPNAVLLAAFAAVSGCVSLESVSAAIAEKFPPAIAKANIDAAAEAWAFIKGAAAEESSAQAG